MTPEAPNANTTTTATPHDTSNSSENAHASSDNPSNSAASNALTQSPHSSQPTSSYGTAELNETFYVNSKSKNTVKIQVILNAEGIYLRRETDQHNNVNEQLIRLVDVIGSRCGQRLKKRTRGGPISCRRLDEHSDDDTSQCDTDSSGQKDTSAYLYIYAYVKTETPSPRRNRTVRILRFRSYEQYKDNFKAAERWHHAICAHKGKKLRDMDTRQLLILLNPKSGSGKGRELFHKQVAPVLKEAQVKYDLQVTTHPNYARELMRQRKDLLECYNGVVVASGDGLFYEVLNGLMERLDWRTVCRKLPIGIIPCGSGNGLAKSIAHLYNEPYEPKPILYATLTCISGNTAPMDIVRVDVGKGDKHTEMYSFLSVGWGLIADVDIESERLRSLGAPRFAIWTLHRFISLRTYKGKLSYLPWQKELHEPSNANGATGDKCFARLDSQEFQDVMELPSNGDDDFADAISLDHHSTLPHIDSWHSAISRRTAYYSIPGQSLRSNRSVAASILSKIEAANAELDIRGPTANIPSLDTPLPTESWQSEEGEYVMVHAAYTTHLSSDCFFAPESRLNDGVIYLVIIRAGIGRSQLFHFLNGMSTGTHLPQEHNEYIQVVPVRAFRIEPCPSKDGIMTVDGERVDYGPIQAEIFPGMINLMVPNGNSI